MVSTKKSKKRKTKRSKMKYPALDRNYNLKTRTDLIDYDYVSKLNDKEKEFLNAFTEEYINANLKHNGKKLHKKKKEKKICYDNNNSRNRCEYTKAKAQNKLETMETFYKEKKRDLRYESFEDDVVDKIDNEFKDVSDYKIESSSMFNPNVFSKRTKSR